MPHKLPRQISYATQLQETDHVGLSQETDAPWDPRDTCSVDADDEVGCFWMSDVI